MDHRTALRVEVNGQMSGKMILVESLEILDISMTGIRFNCMRRVDMNSPHRIKIEKNDISVNLRGTIVRASFKGLHQTEEKSLPVYDVAMHFDHVTDDDKKCLEKLIAILYHE
ncbi:MAG: PilZ domain-containing protein [Nitrospirota bacterium]|nr:PilZ domain-containing protein [Nitrospirota bacterium]